MRAYFVIACVLAICSGVDGVPMPLLDASALGTSGLGVSNLRSMTGGIFRPIEDAKKFFEWDGFGNTKSSGKCPEGCMEKVMDILMNNKNAPSCWQTIKPQLKKCFPPGSSTGIQSNGTSPTISSPGNSTSGQSNGTSAMNSSLGNSTAAQNNGTSTMNSSLGNSTAAQNNGTSTMNSSLGNSTAAQNNGTSSMNSSFGNSTNGQSNGTSPTNSSLGNSTNGQSSGISTTNSPLGNPTNGPSIGTSPTNSPPGSSPNTQSSGTSIMDGITSFGKIFEGEKGWLSECVGTIEKNKIELIRTMLSQQKTSNGRVNCINETGAFVMKEMRKMNTSEACIAYVEKIQKKLNKMKDMSQKQTLTV